MYCNSPLLPSEEAERSHECRKVHIQNHHCMSSRERVMFSEQNVLLYIHIKEFLAQS